MIVLNTAQMREADARSSAEVGDVALMRAAGERIAALVRHAALPGPIIAFAGSGNNGGDAFAALARLQGVERTIYADTAPQPSEARADAEHAARVSGVRVLPFPQTQDEARAALECCALAIAGIVGTGARLPLSGRYAAAVEALNKSATPVIAIDIPPGVNADDGTVAEPALCAADTVTLGALKLGLLLSPGRKFAGRLWLGDIGMPQKTLASAGSNVSALSYDEFVAMLPSRAGSSEKRSAGAPLIVAGSEQFPGAAVLSAMGAARAGAGYVTVGTARSAVSALRMHLVEQVVVTVDSAAPTAQAVQDLLDVAKRCSSVGLGPGLALDERTGEFVRQFCARIDLPMVIDASGLFHFAKNLELLRGKRVVLTPHAGEFARLSGKGTVREEDRVARLREFVDRTGITTLLKGQATLTYDGTSLHVNTTGSSALATAGTGDVLTGIIATLLSQGLSPVDAARAGAYWHGLAGSAAQRKRPRGVIARDVYDSLAGALQPPEHLDGVTRIY